MMQLPAIDYAVLAPLIILVATGLLVLLVDLVSRQAARNVLYGLGVAGCAASFAASLPLSGRTVTTLSGAFAADRFSWGFDALLLLTLAVTFLLSSLKRAEDGGSPGSYAALLIFCTVGGMIMAGAANLIGIFLGVELLSLALYILAGTGYPRQASQEAALKYVLLGSLASGFLIFGSALLYGAAGSIALADLATAAASGAPLFVAGFGLWLVGIAFKLALSPFHTWTPDVYEGSPLAVTAFMAVAVKAATFSVLARFIYTVFQHDSAALIPVWALAILSMLVGNFGAVRQGNLKRLLAFSSIAQAGYIVLALSGVGSKGLSTMLFYLIAYGFMNLGAFATISLLGDGGEEYVDIEGYRGLFFRRPWVATWMTIFFASLAGIPATAGFIGKLLLLEQALGGGPWGIAMAATLILGTLVSFYVYFKVIYQMFLPAQGQAPQFAGNAAASWVAIAVGATGVMLLGIVPQAFYLAQPYLAAASR
ncbi:MAG: NADH-quinone oxidoreductase subunit N [Candidatus Eremiobacteraeota bacterium]|nr:NADH-quinone oxidoreductase subunit N [Candidatus Eremiobacteraeota bacterium]MBC5827646.1 NADH-quinone oxidoreductase subunit N [Candidatus Eremiobacteraeota bacterium]